MDVLDARSTPTVNRLIVVADHHHVCRASRQHSQPRVLNRVGVLEFIHQHVLKTLLVVGQQVATGEPQFVTSEQQFGEVDQPALLTKLFIVLVNTLVGNLKQIVAHGDVFGTSALVLVTVDEPDRLTCRPFLFVDIERAHDPLDQPQLVIRIQYLEVLRQACLLPVHAQQAVGNAVKRADPHGPDGNVEQRLDALAHLSGRLVGESDRQHAMGRNPFRIDQPSDAVHEHPCLAATRSGKDQGVTDRCGHRLALRFVQTFENVGDVHEAVGIALFDGDRLGQISGLIHVGTLQHPDVVSQQL